MRLDSLRDDLKEIWKGQQPAFPEAYLLSTTDADVAYIRTEVYGGEGDMYHELFSIERELGRHTKPVGRSCLKQLSDLHGEGVRMGRFVWLFEIALIGELRKQIRVESRAGDARKWKIWEKYLERLEKLTQDFEGGMADAGHGTSHLVDVAKSVVPFAEARAKREELEEFEEMWYDGVTDRTMDFSVSTKFAILGLIECLEKAGFSVNQGAIIVRDLSGEMGIPFGDPHPGASKNILRRSIIRWRKEKAGLATDAGYTVRFE